MKQISRGIAHLFLILLVVIIGIGIIGYFAYKDGHVKPITSQKQPTPSFIPINEAGISNWKTYKNSNFSFNYPNTWNIPEENQISTSSIVSITDAGESNGVTIKFEVTDGLSFDQATQRNLTFQEFLEKFKPTCESCDISSEPYILGKLLGHRYTYHVHGPGYFVTDIFLSDSPESTRIITISYRHGPNEYESSISQTLSQILSTFKFVETSDIKTENIPTLSTTGWKIAKLNGLKFKVPPNARCKSNASDTEENYNNCKLVYYHKESLVPTKFDIIDYLGGSRRSQFFENFALEGYQSCDTIARESMFGNVRALQIAVGDCAFADGGIVAVIGNKLFIKQQLFFHYQTREIERFDLLDTTISTLRLE
jgi:hypothetical protein